MLEKVTILAVLGFSIFILPTVVGWLYGCRNKTPDELQRENEV